MSRFSALSFQAGSAAAYAAASLARSGRASTRARLSAYLLMSTRMSITVLSRIAASLSISPALFSSGLAYVAQLSLGLGEFFAKRRDLVVEFRRRSWVLGERIQLSDFLLFKRDSWSFEVVEQYVVAHSVYAVAGVTH